jgi:hypothetical protein
VPSLDLRFADNKSLADAVTGASLVTFTRASTGTFVNSAGVLQTAATDVPRFDHNPTTGESLGLLVEEARTNLCLQSENFSTTWTTFRASVSANATAAPDGNTTADKIVEDTTATNSHGVQQASISFTSGTSYTFSVYVKAAERANIRFTLPAAAFTSALAAQFNLALATTTTASSGVTATITELQNNWYRCTMTAAATATASGTVGLQMGENSTSTTVNYTGNGTSGLFLWGAQLEAGAFPTSYIATTGATATRAADVVSITGSAFSSWYNAPEGTIFHQGATPALANFFSIDDGTVNNRITSYLPAATAPGFFVATGGVAQANIFSSTITAGSTFAQANSYKAANFAIAVNGGTVGTSSSGSIPIVNKMVIGANVFAGAYVNGTIRRLVFWPQRLPNPTLQSITL